MTGASTGRWALQPVVTGGHHQAMANVDLKKVYKTHYSARADEPVVVDIPARRFLMIDGAGDPNTAAAYLDAVQALYPMAYGVRAAIKAATGDAYTVMPLEGLWWTDDMRDFDPGDKSNWLWTVMICLPEVLTEALVEDVLPAITAEKQLKAGHLARVETFTEGRAAQILHFGPYADEGPTIAALHRFISDGNHRLTGKHHEIYLSDPRRTDPAKLRTIIRQPFTDG